ncbi:hypothetical protein HBI56_081540 [Parastagonospora nodorum]|nr:hypothetical protein HBI10_121030 [Parastagonospora nodorum]KAH4025006.1 hypothetical protein HBI13_076160 [Parastagonospora nodorum]KAH5399280.1 hypothetical protein HBI32_182590 [Parastagonospora nodorum]KAH5540968.1 hypothetical protein HBI27_096680 [Parastagonospora nodorum]KAH6523269.1 hypothetical protein HBI56_081540 [Parastagonospora nodorum]
MATLKDLPVELMLRIVHYVSETMHEDTDTAKFLESPILAPREVDRAFWRLTLARYQDLRHLALTSRVMRPLAQEYLFRAVAVDNSVRTERGAITGIHRLLIVLSQRPDLAKRAQSLHIDVNPFVVQHSEHALDLGTGCEKTPCYCRLHELQGICATLVEGIEMSLWLTKAVPSSSRRKRYGFYTEWQKILRNEYDHCFTNNYAWAAITGIIPYLLPNLSALSLNTYRDDEAAFHFSLGLPVILKPALIAGFLQITSLKTTFVPPWAAVTMPTVRSLHIDLGDARGWYEDEEFGPAYYDVSKGDNPGIKSVIIDLSVIVLESVDDNDFGFRLYNSHYDTAQKLVRNLAGLCDLQIRLSYRSPPNAYLYEDMHWERLEPTYGTLTGLLHNATVESVTIDAADVNWSLYEEIIQQVTYAHTWRVQAESIGGFYTNTSGSDNWTLSNLPNVRRLVLPQEALIGTHAQGWRPAPLPENVEEVGVIDSTRILNHWARYVLEYPSEYPNLKRISLWCDRLAISLSPDPRLRQVHDSVDHPVAQDTSRSSEESPDDVEDPYFSERFFHRLDRDLEEAIEEEDKLGDEDDRIWDELQRAGIEVVINLKQNRGWRHTLE